MKTLGILLVLLTTSGLARGQVEWSTPALALSASPAEIEAGHRAFVELSPELAKPLALVGLGSAAVLGFSPFVRKGWQGAGVGPTNKIRVFIGRVALARGWRIFRHDLSSQSSPKEATAALQAIRLREVARIDQAAELARIVGAPKAQAKGLQATLRAHGVVVVARPAPLPGLLMGRVKDGQFHLSHIHAQTGRPLPWDLAVEASEPLPEENLPHLALLEQKGIWAILWPQGAGASFAAANAGQRSCAIASELAKTSAFTAVTLQITPSSRAIATQLSFRNPDDELLGALASARPISLPQLPAPLLSASASLSALASLRGIRRAKEGPIWDQIYWGNRRCGSVAQELSWLAAWPTVAGRYVQELAALHPQAAMVVAGLGAATASAQGAPLRGIIETTLPKDVAHLPREWLARMFGGQAGDATYGSGPLQPYALRVSGGEVIGAAVGPGQRERALKARRSSVSVDTIAHFDVRLTELARAIADLDKRPPRPGREPILPHLARIERAIGNVTSSAEAVVFSLELALRKP